MTTARRLDTLTLRVPDVASTLAFYTKIMGMLPSNSDNDGDSATIGYTDTGLKLKFVSCQSNRQTTSSDAYWKIGITVKDLDQTVAFLQKQGVPCSPPQQFMDIGYLCHLRDPANLSVELLQQRFEGRQEAVRVNQNEASSHVIGCQATLAHITIRVTDLKMAQKFWEETMGMRLMSIQPVTRYGFTLYFYTWSDENLPNPNDLKAVENREWLWARPYAMIELQHLESRDADDVPKLRITPDGEAGPVTLLCHNNGSNESTEIDCGKDLGL
eukprot:CAMPEP_0194062822 /NCGR_PEP_ID=MMETSP0009_2-20130614/78644_1 /TAXON_ID=210454 /ORGANISM="Grammatophora oceanica, Strain CCMP 410" /LENGTH=270 /DNA_ID=CAMNT_0038714713 /DNA_START=223 /DNA_END=1035 /DNA_ORIENTATION=+